MNQMELDRTSQSLFTALNFSMKSVSVGNSEVQFCTRKEPAPEFSSSTTTVTTREEGSSKWDPRGRNQWQSQPTAAVTRGGDGVSTCQALAGAIEGPSLPAGQHCLLGSTEEEAEESENIGNTTQFIRRGARTRDCRICDHPEKPRQHTSVPP